MLVHAGAGGAGSAAIQLASRSWRAGFATAGTAEKVTLCSELGAQVVINYRTDNFSDIVLEETQGQGVDVVFDTVGESVMETSLRCTGTTVATS